MKLDIFYDSDVIRGRGAIPPTPPKGINYEKWYLQDYLYRQR